MKILLAEDDVRLGKLVFHLLSKQNHLVDYVQNGRVALDYAEATHYDVIVLDWMMPLMSGIDVCSLLRKKGYQGGIILLTAKDDLTDIVAGLDHGADDYVIKPFKTEELLARLRAISKRKDKPYEEELRAGNMRLNVESGKLVRDHEEIDLTKKELQLLEYLFRNKGRILTREQIIDRIWGYDGEITDNALDSLVKLVRKKIDQKGEPSLIQSVRGIGYKMRDSHV